MIVCFAYIDTCCTCVHECMCVYMSVYVCVRECICVYMSMCCRLERLDHLAQKFRHKCDIHEEWTFGKEDLLQAQDFKQCRLNELKVCV